MKKRVYTTTFCVVVVRRALLIVMEAIVIQRVSPGDFYQDHKCKILIKALYHGACVVCMATGCRRSDEFTGNKVMTFDGPLGCPRCNKDPYHSYIYYK